MITGRIATLAGLAGPGWAEAIAVTGGRIGAAGSVAEVAAAAGPRTRHLRLAPDEVAIPGLTDSHLHLAEAALARHRVDLEGVRTTDELLARVRAAAESESRPDARAWIQGGGWDADLLGRWPTADDLELAAPGRLVTLWAHDRHSLLASERVLAATGIDEGTGDPGGGVIRRDATGRPTGVLHELACDLVSAIVPPPSGEDVAAALRPMVAELLALGVVAAHDPGGLNVRRDLHGPFEAYRGLAGDGALGIRVHVCLRPEQLDAVETEGLRSGRPIGPDPLGRLRLGWLKTFADGSLGSRSAALLEPLDGIPGEPAPPNGGYGVWLASPEELRAQAARAASLGIATQIHGIGDAAVRAALDALGPTVGSTTLMPRVEHAQMISLADVPRFAALGIAASVQPIHVRSDAEKARRLWGSRAEERAYAFGALDRTAAVMCFGTDAPVEPVNPWPGLACAVTRSSPEWPAGSTPFGEANALSLWRAIRASCVDPAVSAGEGDRGRLVPGHRADIVVLPRAAVEEPVEIDGPLWHARPRMVLVDGEVVAGA
jgi:predicted amidohydrolase YtcJ